MEALSFQYARLYWFVKCLTIFLPSSKFGRLVRRKAFLLCKNPCGRAAMGDGGPHRRGGSPPRKEISRGNLLCAESGLPSLSYPRLQSVQKYVGTPNRYNRLYRAARGVRGAAPLCFRRSPEETIPKGFLWAISSRRLDTALLCAAKKRGVESPGWQASASGTLAPALRQEVKRQPRQARPNLNLSFQPSQGFYKLRCCSAAAANEARAGFDKPLYMLRKLA